MSTYSIEIPVVRVIEHEIVDGNVVSKIIQETSFNSLNLDYEGLVALQGVAAAGVAETHKLGLVHAETKKNKNNPRQR